MTRLTDPPDPSNTEDEAIKNLTRAHLFKVLSMLSDVQQRVLRLGFGLDDLPPASDWEIAKIIGSSPEFVSTLIRDTLEHLKVVFGDDFKDPVD